MLTDEERWCTSCGAPVPPGVDACPVCGMPVEGAFDDTDEPEEEEAPELPPLISALPEVPTDGSDTNLRQSRGERVRQLLIAAAAALVVVGGTTLFITRPWNPHAFDTRATEEADTSMAGFPGEVSHLTSQDFVEAQKRAEYAISAQKKLVAFRARLPKWAVAARTSLRVLEGCLRTGDFSALEAEAPLAAALDADVRSYAAELRGLELEGEEQEAEREKLLVLSDYLSGETGVLASAWGAAEHAPTVADAQIDAQAALSRAAGGHTIAEWDALFVNAWKASV